MSVNGMAPISEAKTCQLQQEQQQRRKRNAFSPQLPSSQKFSSRCFSSWWLLITSQWLHVWVASLCYLHPTFFKLTWQLSYNFSWPYFNQRLSFLFDAPVLKGLLLGRTIKWTWPTLIRLIFFLNTIQILKSTMTFSFKANCK